MGQYHYVVNLTKRQYLHAHNFGDGLKLMEMACSAEGTLGGLAVLLADSNGRGGGDLHVPDGHQLAHLVGSWAGDRIVVTGDYGTAGQWTIEDDELESWLHEWWEQANDYDREQASGGHSAEEPDWHRRNLYHIAAGCFCNISDDVVQLIADCEGPQHRLHKKLNPPDLGETYAQGLQEVLWRMNALEAQADALNLAAHGVELEQIRTRLNDLAKSAKLAVEAGF